MTNDEAGTAGFYKRLTRTFPAHEMKAFRHMQGLLARPETAAGLRFILEETAEYVMLYAESPRFIFLDYVAVEAELRGRGIGSVAFKSLVERATQTNKFVVLEVDTPVSELDWKRVGFYKKQGMALFDNVAYNRVWSYDTIMTAGEMQIMATANTPTDDVRAAMRLIFAEIHTWSMSELYKRPAPLVEEVFP